MILTHHLPSGLNGQVCKVKGPKDADRFDVQLVDGSIKAVKTDNLRVLAEPGSLVVPLNVEQVSRDQMLGNAFWTLESFKIGINHLGYEVRSEQFSTTMIVRERVTTDTHLFKDCHYQLVYSSIMFYTLTIPTKEAPHGVESDR